jgi:hypothetical protein
MMLRYGLGIVVLLLWVLPAPAAAQESFDRVISQLITGVDTATPTAPTNLQATPLSISSIELNWAASVDNVGVTGYRVWRDALQIGTTTLTTFTDTGLATSTSYQYYVTAFDAAGNQSASSSEISASTLAPAPPDVEPRTGTLLPSTVTVSDIAIIPGTNSLLLTFTTSRFMRAQVRWRTGERLVGSAVSTNAAVEHRILIDELTPVTLYELELTIFGGSLRAGASQQLFARTLVEPDTTPPANVRNLQAVDTGRGVALTWENPTDEDFDRVRIVRSTRYFPLDTVDGWVVYEAAGESFTDSERERPVYYTVFTIDATGNVSSGAVVYVPERTLFGGPARDTEAPLAIPPGVEPVLLPTSAWPVYLVQSDRVALLSTSTPFSLASGQPFTVRVPAAQLPQNLKTVVATLQHPRPEAGSFQFLLQRSADGEAYEATIGQLPEGGQYPLVVAWFDFRTSLTGRAEGSVVLTGVPAAPPRVSSWWWVLILLGAVVAVRILRR